MNDTIAEVARGLQDMVRVPRPLGSAHAVSRLGSGRFVGRSLPSPRLADSGTSRPRPFQLTLQGGSGGGGGAYGGKGVSCAGGGLR